MTPEQAEFIVLEHATQPILADILAERVRQHRLHGDQSHLPMGTDPGFRVNADEARKVCDHKTMHGGLTFRHILAEEFWEVMAETDDDRLYAELVQVAAVACQWAEAIRKRQAKP